MLVCNNLKGDFMQHKFVDIALGMAVPLLFMVLFAPIAKAQGPVINLQTKTASVPDGDGGRIIIPDMAYEAALLDGPNIKSIRIYRWGEHVCSDLRFVFFDLQPNQTRTIAPENGEPCMIILPDGRPVQGVGSNWKVLHTLGWDADRKPENEDDDWCSALHEFWCRIY